MREQTHFGQILTGNRRILRSVIEWVYSISAPILVDLFICPNPSSDLLMID